MVSVPFFHQGLRQPAGHAGHTVEDFQKVHDIRLASASVQSECIGNNEDAIEILPIQ